MIPLIWEIRNQINNVEIAVGCYKNHAYLFEKTPINQLIIHPKDDGESFDDLSYMCPPEFINIYTWLGQYIDTRSHTWESCVKLFNYKCKENNLDITLISNIIPGIKFPFKKLKVPIHPNMIWVENGITRSGHSFFNFDMEKLGKLFPNYYFYTTSSSNIFLPNVIDCSTLNLLELSTLSNYCSIILGKGSGPYFTTLTEFNRYKPRAVVGYDTINYLPFWDFIESPITYLEDENQLIKYLNEHYYETNS